jgi:glutamate dehydrogenase/leucine dehydrogenase
MNAPNLIIDGFSGVAEFKIVTTDIATGSETISTYLKYYSHGVVHRDDGPAVLLEGNPHEWWINGRQLSADDYGHYLVKKALREKLESKLNQKGCLKRGKI